MYQQHFGFSESPFSISPDPRFLYMSGRHREALAHLVYGASENGGFVLLTGQVGTGKTTLIRSLLRQSIDNVEFALCLYSGFSEIEFLSLILDELGAPYPENSNRKELIYALNEHALKVHAAGGKIVIIIDEAQNLSRDLLEQIRLLTNLETNTQKLLRIILVGQEELQDKLANVDLRQLSQRITTRYHLTALSLAEVNEYIVYRLQIAGGSPNIIPASVRRRVYQLSHGTPRLVNVICERALLGAYANDRDKLTIKDVELAAKKALAPVIGFTKDKPVQVPGFHTKRWHLGYFACSLAIIITTILFLRSEIGVGFITNAFKINDGLTSISSASSELTTSSEAIIKSDLANSQDDAVVSSTANDQRAAALAELKSLQSEKEYTSRELNANKTSKVKDTLESKVVAKEHDENPEIFEHLDNLNVKDKLASANDHNQSKPVTSDVQSSVIVTKSQLKALYDKSLSRPKMMLELAELWGKGTAINLENSYCADLLSMRMKCVDRIASLRLISQINRPTLIELSPSKSKEAIWVLLKEIDSDSMTLSIANQTLKVKPEIILTDFTSRIFMLLREPNTTFELRPGDSGKQAAWLAERLQLYRNEPIMLEGDSAKYNKQLQSQVMAFQRDYGLAEDGVVGEETLLYLYNLVATESTPTLTNR